MPVRTIDGTLEAVTVKRKTSKLWRLADVRIRKTDGTVETLPKTLIATPNVAAKLTEGASGRFYVFKAPDHSGIHGVRLADGSLVSGFPRVNETLMLVLLPINILVLMLVFTVNAGIALLPALLIPFSAVMWYLYRQTRLEAEAQLAADGRAP